MIPSSFNNIYVYVFSTNLCSKRAKKNRNFQQMFCKESAMKSSNQSNDYKTACVLIIFMKMMEFSNVLNSRVIRDFRLI